MLVIPIDELSLTKKNDVLRFLQKYEPYCVQLNGRIKKDSSSSCAIYVSDVKSQELYGIISFGSVIFHCFPYLDPFKSKNSQFTALQQDLIQSLKQFVQKENLKMPSCISGTENGTEILKKVYEELGYCERENRFFNLLKLNPAGFAEVKLVPLKDGEKFLRLKSDMDSKMRMQLQEMQNNYELEEVQPACFEFDEDSCRLRLSNALRTQFIAGILNQNGKIITKAGTSAFGYKYVQIGGVYTCPEFRRKGYSKQLLLIIIRKLLLSRRIPVLFVNKENTAAGMLYEKLSFFKIADYEIIYF